MTTDLGAVGDRGLDTENPRTKSSAHRVGNGRIHRKTLAAVSLGLVVIVAAVACYVASPGTPKTVKSYEAPWTISVVDSSGGYDPSIAIDSADNVHISYRGSEGLMYATNPDGSWAISQVDNVNADRTSLALDSNDRAHISYRNASGYLEGSLKYATNVDGS